MSFLCLRHWCILALFLPFCGYSQTYNFQELSIQQGLPQSQAIALLFDSDNIAWIGTQGGGLCQYDGSEIKTITKNDSLISNRIYCLREINKEIWVGQKGGVSVLTLDGEVKTNVRFTSRSMVVQDIINYDGTTYLACSNGVWEYKAGEFTKYDKNPGIASLNTEKFFIDSDSTLWTCTHEGMYHFTDFTKKITNARGLKGTRVTCAVSFKGLKIIGTYDGGLNVYDSEKGFLDFPALEELKDKIILSLFVSKNEELWIGTLNNGVYAYTFDDIVPKHYTAQNGLTNNHVTEIVSDYWENIWLGTSGGGVSIFQNSPFMKYSTSSGLNSNYVFSVINDEQNNLWASTEGAGVVRINDTSVVLFDEEFGFHLSKVKALFEDKDGNIWMGTEGEGLGIFLSTDEKDTVYSVKGRNGLRANWIKSFSEDPSNGQVYIGTSDGGIQRVWRGDQFPESVRFSTLKASNGDIPKRIDFISFLDEQLWFVNTKGKFGFLEDKDLTLFDKTEYSFRNVVGGDGHYWLGTTDNGVYHIQLDKDSIITESWLNASNYLRSNNIYQLVKRGNELWVGTEKGLERLDLDSTVSVINQEHYGYEEGFEGVETNINASFLDANDNLWFGTVDGLYLYQGGDVNYAQRQPPILTLEDFKIAYQSIEETKYSNFYEDGEMLKSLLLEHDENNISFDFRAIHYAYSNNIRYRWILEGVDPDWNPPTKVNTATYSNLPPGKYKFLVKASIDDNWDVDPIEIEFEIDQPYWEKFWFKASLYSGIGFVVLIIVLIVLLRIRRRNRTIRERLELEKNMIELEQKALRLQMNPHFIFNVLTQIHNLIILNESDKARYALAKFSKLMRRVLENSREKFISIDDEMETLENYVQLEKLTTGTDVELVFDLDGDIDTVEEILPPLMIQPFIENALIHGLKELDRPGEIKVSFKLLHEHLLEVSIRDNGIGRKRASEINAQKENYHKSTALQVTQERLASLNENPEFVPFEILDHVNKLGDPEGTEIIFRLQI